MAGLSDGFGHGNGRGHPCRLIRFCVVYLQTRQTPGDTDGHRQAQTDTDGHTQRCSCSPPGPREGRAHEKITIIIIIVIIILNKPKRKKKDRKRNTKKKYNYDEIEYNYILNNDIYHKYIWIKRKYS